MVDFNPEKYQAQIEESRKRLEIARSFREPDRVPILISTGVVSILSYLAIT